MNRQEEQRSFVQVEEADQGLMEQAISLLAQELGLGQEAIPMIRRCFRCLLNHDGENVVAYTRFFRPKASGGKREILAPVEDPPLRQLLRRIMDEILYRRYPGGAVHGWRPSRSIVTNAQVHLEGGCNYALNVDIKDCFPSTPIKRVEQVYWDILGNYLIETGEESAVVSRLVNLLAFLSTFQQSRQKISSLPMGAATSPALVNIILSGFDADLRRVLGKLDPEICVTRFGDDITISSPKTLPRQTLSIIKSLVIKYGYRLNDSKTRWMRRGGSSKPIEVTGVIIGEDRLLWSDEKLKRYELYLIKAFGQYAPSDMNEKVVQTIQTIVGLGLMIYRGKLPPRLDNCINKIIEQHPGQSVEVERIFFGKQGRDKKNKRWWLLESQDQKEPPIWQDYESWGLPPEEWELGFEEPT